MNTYGQAQQTENLTESGLNLVFYMPLPEPDRDEGSQALQLVA